MTGRAFAPGHVSGVFAVHDQAADSLAKGSRGAGWSVDAGAHAVVTKAAHTSIHIDGREQDAPVTRLALARLSPTPVQVNLKLDLPVGQGFGMSAAGTLAACLATTSLLGLDSEAALVATHAAEVESGTGLGDAIGSWFGAGEVRLKPGCPPAGWAMRLEPPEATRFLYVVLGAGIATPAIIRDAAWKARTRTYGDACVDRILAAGREAAWETMLVESARFSHELGLMTEEMRELGARLDEHLHWGQSMLGNTIWVTGDTVLLEHARPLLAAAGTVLEQGVDTLGARIVR